MAERGRSADWWLLAGSLPFGVLAYFLVLVLGSGQESSAPSSAPAAPAAAAPPEARGTAGSQPPGGRKQVPVVSGSGLSVRTPRNPRDVDVYRDDGRVSPELLSLAGIPESRMEEAESMIDRFWQEAGKEFEARAQRIEAESDEAQGISAYRIPAAPELARILSEKLEAEIRGKFGAGAARVLVPELTGFESFAGIGKHDAKLVFRPSQGYPSDWKEKLPISAELEVTDPKTGEKLLITSTIRSDRLQPYVGSTFGKERVRMER